VLIVVAHLLKLVELDVVLLDLLEGSRLVGLRLVKPVRVRRREVLALVALLLEPTHLGNAVHPHEARRLKPLGALRIELEANLLQGDLLLEYRQDGPWPNSCGLREGWTRASGRWGDGRAGCAR